MKNLDRNHNQATSQQINAYQRGQLQQKLESYKQQNDQYWQQLEEQGQQLEEKGAQIENLQQEVEETFEIARQEQKKNEGLLQRLMDAIQSRNSMRGRLGNMTAQRNRALQQVEMLAAQNQEFFQQQKDITDKLGKAYQQIGGLQEEYDQDMTELARAYREASPGQRQLLPLKLRQMLDQIDENYRG